MKNTNHKIAFALAVVLAASLPAGPALSDTPSAFCGTIDPDNATYHGIEGLEVTLTDGEWEGEPYVEDGAARPRVGRARDIEICGDLDGDGEDETVVVLWFASGGSGTFQYLALLKPAENDSVNIATTPIGDRVKVESGSMADGRIHLDVIQHGPDDPACCPTHAVTRHYDAALNLVDTTERKSP